jgi:hypothetical protein
MRALHFRDAAGQKEDFSLDFPDDYTISDVLDILATREELNRASLHLSHHGAAFTPETLVEAVETTESDPILLHTRTPARPVPSPVPARARDLSDPAVLADFTDKLLQTPRILERLYFGESVSLMTYVAGLAPTRDAVSPAQADAILRRARGIGLADAYAMVMRQPIAFALEGAEVAKMTAFWREVYDRMAAFDKQRVDEIVRSGIPANNAVQLFMAAGKDLEVAKGLWQGTI